MQNVESFRHYKLYHLGSEGQCAPSCEKEISSPPQGLNSWPSGIVKGCPQTEVRKGGRDTEQEASGGGFRN